MGMATVIVPTGTPVASVKQWSRYVVRTTAQFATTMEHARMVHASVHPHTPDTTVQLRCVIRRVRTTATATEANATAVNYSQEMHVELLLVYRVETTTVSTMAIAPMALTVSVWPTTLGSTASTGTVTHPARMVPVTMATAPATMATLESVVTRSLSFAASATASFATTMGTVPMGPVSVHPRTPDTTAPLRCVFHLVRTVPATVVCAPVILGSPGAVVT